MAVYVHACMHVCVSGCVWLCVCVCVTVCVSVCVCTFHRVCVCAWLCGCVWLWPLCVAVCGCVRLCSTDVLAATLETMLEAGISAVPVVEPDSGRLVAVFSFTDMLDCGGLTAEEVDTALRRPTVDFVSFRWEAVAVCCGCVWLCVAVCVAVGVC